MLWELVDALLTKLFAPLQATPCPLDKIISLVLSLVQYQLNLFRFNSKYPNSGYNAQNWWSSNEFLWHELHILKHHTEKGKHTIFTATSLFNTTKRMGSNANYAHCFSTKLLLHKECIWVAIP
jgi:hypothetical protein